MKVLIISTSDQNGGAARAAFRLHESLRRKGIDSYMLVQHKGSSNEFVIGPSKKMEKIYAKIRQYTDTFPLKLYRNTKDIPFSNSFFPYSGIIKKIDKINPDIIHLNWINKGMMSLYDLKKIKKPIIWTLHDNWAFTGGCHIMQDCIKYKKECCNCPKLNSKLKYDLSYLNFKLKEYIFKSLNNVTIIGVSSWLSSCIKSSYLLKNNEVITLPNIIDTKVFKNIDKSIAREILGISLDKKILLFGAFSATKDKNKGFHILADTLDLISNDDFEVVVFGSSSSSYRINQKIHYLGHVHDDVTLGLIYSAVDVLVVPSLQESFGQTATEAMSCGTPVVGFGNTGLMDIVDHLENGYLAKPFEVDDLVNGINWVTSLDNKDIGIKARKKIIQSFDSQTNISKYIKLYNEKINLN